MPNGNNDLTCSIQLQASYTHLTHWEELLHLIETNCALEEPHCLTAIYKCNLMMEQLDEVYMELLAPGQMMNVPLYGQILNNSCLSTTFKAKLGHHLIQFLLEMKTEIGKDNAEHVIRWAKVILASLLMVSYTLLLISIYRLWRDPIKMKQWWMRRPVGKRLTVVWI